MWSVLQNSTSPLSPPLLGRRCRSATNSPRWLMPSLAPSLLLRNRTWEKNFPRPETQSLAVLRPVPAAPRHLCVYVVSHSPLSAVGRAVAYEVLDLGERSALAVVSICVSVCGLHS